MRIVLLFRKQEQLITAELFFSALPSIFISLPQKVHSAVMRNHPHIIHLDQFLSDISLEPIVTMKKHLVNGDIGFLMQQLQASETLLGSFTSQMKIVVTSE